MTGPTRRAWARALAALLLAGLAMAAGDDVNRRGQGGDECVFGGSVRVDQSVSGDRLAAGGNVESAAGSLRLGPNARIAGKLRVRSGSEVERDAAAQVGALEQIAPAERPRADGAAGERRPYFVAAR